MTLTAALAPDAVVGPLCYAVPTGEKLVNETFGPNNIRRRSTGTYATHAMRIENGRPHAAGHSIDSNGFQLVRHRTAMRDFFDPQELSSVYYPECVELVKQVSGAHRAHLFDHTLRSGDETERETKLLREPVLYVHNDYTERSGPWRLRELLPDEADALAARRFAIIQIWRPIDRPVLRDPLALGDARSFAPGDLLASERRYPHRVGETYRAQYNPAHRWTYFPQMQRDEAIVFKVYDSATDGRARFTPHTAFEDPTTPADAPPRQSIETRLLAFF